MILSGHQPVYLPGIILFTKIALSDEFMFVGHCAPGDGTWHNRNYIRGARLTIPIKHGASSISETEMDGDHWRRKHIRSIELAYKDRPYFDLYFPQLRDRINNKCWRYLGGFNEMLIWMICDWLNIRKKFWFSTNMRIVGQKTQMLISMCNAVQADEYLSNEGARDYVDELSMALAGIRHRWLDFKHPVYDQGEKEFQTNLSVIDLLFNCGPDSGRIVREAGRVS